MKMNSDANHPWLRPLWRRVLVTAICFAIALWDLWNGDYVWALIFGGMGGYAIHIFFIAWNKDQPEKRDDE